MACRPRGCSCTGLSHARRWRSENTSKPSSRPPGGTREPSSKVGATQEALRSHVRSAVRRGPHSDWPHRAVCERKPTRVRDVFQRRTQGHATASLPTSRGAGTPPRLDRSQRRWGSGRTLRRVRSLRSGDSVLGGTDSPHGLDAWTRPECIERQEACHPEVAQVQLPPGGRARNLAAIARDPVCLRAERLGK